MATVEINGTATYYERAGNGPTILFVHGTAGDADSWTDQCARLSDRYMCVRYDRRGHSRSTRGTAPISYDTYADDAAALIEALGLAPCLLVGSSSGGAIAVAVALRHPHLLRGLLVGEPPLFSLDRSAGDAMLRELLPRLDAALGSGGPEAGIDAFFEYVCAQFWSSADPRRRGALRANAGIAFTDFEALSMDLTPSDLASVHVPTLVVGGTESLPAFRSVARQLSSALPDARYVEFANSGHVTYAERPAEFAETVSVFALELDRRSRSNT